MEFTVWTSVIMLMMFSVVVANILILLVLLRTDMLQTVNKYFFLSLTVSDLSFSVFIVVFSFWTSLFDGWIYGDAFCLFEGYLAAILSMASIYSLAWLSIDHYVAVRKPDRYESLMTRTRCICWVVIIWVTAFSFCCPPLFGLSRAHFYSEAYICIIDWNLHKAYIITSGLLMIVPPVIALTVANLYIFTESYQQKKAAFEKLTDRNSRPDMYYTNVIVGFVYFLSWLPWCLVKFYETVQRQGSLETSPDMHLPKGLHFALLWFAMSNSFWRFLVYLISYHDFRIGLKILYARIVYSIRGVGFADT